MKILYILKSKPDEIASRLIEAQRKGNDVTVMEIFAGFSAVELLESVEKADKVICW
ncbi:MAG: hypothetical protein M0018_03380 [Nitrospiraceae bacterium]|nr:hypothetical protein [Nitrospiraceae bacterium]